MSVHALHLRNSIMTLLVMNEFKTSWLMTSLGRAQHPVLNAPQQKIFCFRALRSSSTGTYSNAHMCEHAIVVDNCVHATFVLSNSISLKR